MDYSILPKKQGFTMRLNNGTTWDFDVDKISENATHLFITHAHSDHIPTRKIPLHITLVTTRETFELLKLFKKISPNHNKVIFTDHEFDNIALQLLPAGHTIGSVAFRFTFEDGTTFLYTGDFSLEKKQGVKAFHPQKTDHVIMEATYGRKDFVFPSATTILEQAVNLVEDAKKRAAIVLRAYPYGKAQTILSSSLGKYITAMSSRTYQISHVLHELGHHFSLPNTQTLPLKKGDIYLAGPREQVPVAPNTELFNISFTGWAKSNRSFSFHEKNHVNPTYSIMLPLSDHADYMQLLKASKSFGALSIGIFCGYKKYFVKVLRDLGFFAYDLETYQLSLDQFIH